jgi:glycosyltransferase involved in cell wall biosynthesis
VKKIAFSHNTFPSGGAERVTLDIAKYMVESDPTFKFYVFAYKVNEELCTEEVRRYTTIIKVSSNRHKRCEEIANHIANEGIGLLIQVVKPLADIDLIRQKTGVKVIFANHGEPFWEQYTIAQKYAKKRWFKPLWKPLLRRCFEDWGIARRVAIARVKRNYRNVDAYTVLCEEYKHDVCRALGIAPETSRVVAIENSEATVTDVNYHKEKIILFCGRLVNVSKRLDRLLRIWGMIQHKLPDYRLVIVGDGEYRKAMEAQIAHEHLERVEMVGQRTDVDTFYRKASIVALTSQYEGWGLCLTEGQAHGCIPIAFGCSAGVRTILSPSGINGFIVEPYDERAYAETLLHIATMGDHERETIRHNVVAKSANYAPHIIMQKWADLIASLLK